MKNIDEDRSVKKTDINCLITISATPLRNPYK